MRQGAMRQGAMRQGAMRRDAVRQGAMRRGEARRGEARRGEARQREAGQREARRATKRAPPLSGRHLLLAQQRQRQRAATAHEGIQRRRQARAAEDGRIDLVEQVAI